MNQTLLKPQLGAQTEFLSNPSDIVIYGGAAGGGKTYALLLESLRYINTPNFGVVIFRRQKHSLFIEGGLWDEAEQLYPLFGARPNKSKAEWIFPNNNTISFSHLNQEKDKYHWHGSQIPLIMFDELTQFTESQFIYMLSRNRSNCGIKPYIRATCNPQTDHWLMKYIHPFINPQGYPDPQQSGRIYYLGKYKNQLYLNPQADEVLNQQPLLTRQDLKTFSFIPSTIYDNPALLKKNPDYLANLKNLDHIEQEQLLHGNWKVKNEHQYLFKPDFFCPLKPNTPTPNYRFTVRHWDLASTEKTLTNNPDWTVGCLLSLTHDNQYHIRDIIRTRQNPAEIENLLITTAQQDGPETIVSLPQDPGQAGKYQIEKLKEQLFGFTVISRREDSNKIVRAKHLLISAQQQGFYMNNAHWNKDFIQEVTHFPLHPFDDQVDALTGAFFTLHEEKKNQQWIFG